MTSAWVVVELDSPPEELLAKHNQKKPGTPFTRELVLPYELWEVSGPQSFQVGARVHNLVLKEFPSWIQRDPETDEEIQKFGSGEALWLPERETFEEQVEARNITHPDVLPEDDPYENYL